MARYSKTLTPATQAAFVAALAGGALVGAAAKVAGVSLSTLYWRRGRDVALADAWRAAVAASGGVAQPGLGSKKRRMRFDAARRAHFLAGLPTCCDTTACAAAAGVDVATVHRRIARDPDFARASKAALARGYALLEAEAVRQREARAERLGRRDWAVAPHAPPRIETDADFDRAMKLLARYERRDGTIGPRRVRYGRMRRCSFEEAIAALDRKLRGLGLRSGR